MNESAASLARRGADGANQGARDHLAHAELFRAMQDGLVVLKPGLPRSKGHGAMRAGVSAVPLRSGKTALSGTALSRDRVA